MDCPHCKRSFDFNDCITEPGAEPADGDTGMCYSCGGWWEMTEGRLRTYTPTREQMEAAYPHLAASKRRAVEDEKRHRARIKAKKVKSS